MSSKMIDVLIRRESHQGAWPQRKNQRGHSEKALIQKPENSGEVKPADIWILDFQFPELWENKFLLFKAPSL